MSAPIFVWSLCLVLAACHYVQNASAILAPEKVKDCDEERFSNERERCDFGIKLRLLVSHGDALVGCAALDSYKMCLAELVGQTMCGQREFLLKELEPMRLYLLQNNVRTVSAYYDCLNALLGTASCQQSPLLMKHADYFPTVLTRKYRAACEEELSLTAMRIIDSVQGECFARSHLDFVERPEALLV
ncbi:hypothetical protein IscW_ISCW010308 [Ixodes scapularis]|uniref:Secreted protein n=1 Tax=Ixodes scapularis TaxID=6945 RepID=B7Q0J6_IXOSC|nr:hypothetical protein IscW_ISCW010308 [Ixodes scapularis]|eukprot:XP_002407912.1 hypothetical protein IscW_ISCW010308 [Ixodes scapularis]